VTHDEEPSGGAQPEEDEPIFICGMAWIVDQPRALISENTPGLFESDAVLLGIS
jgi:hypothetical protein